MVLESLADPLGAEKHPGRMFWYGFLYTSIAIVLSLWIFASNASMVMVFLTTLACVPLMYNTVKLEEQKDESIVAERSLLKEHGRALLFFVFLFLGMVAAYTAWFIFLPPDTAGTVFSAQVQTISDINAPVGHAVSPGAQVTHLFKIILNNTRVLIFCLLFAFLYGVGAIFILAWNASVIGSAMGSLIKTQIAALAGMVGLSSISGYFTSVTNGFFRYAIHGIPEITSYFIAGLAAGIISVAVMKKGVTFERLKHIFLDVSDLIIAAFALLVVSALLEVFVTAPLFA